MILDLVRVFDERLDRTLYVGDSPEDLEAAQRAGIAAFMPAYLFFNRPEPPLNAVKSDQVTP